MRIFVTALLGAVVLLSASCGKTKEDSRQRRFVSLKLDNRIYLCEDPKGVINLPDFTDQDPNNDYPKMEITGQSYNADVIRFTLVAPEMPFKPGVYPCTQEGNELLMVLNSAAPTTLSSQGSTNCYITITAIDNVTVEGTFNGTLSDVTGAGGPRTVKDGAFRAIITQTGN
ncbi:hypothetical protein [Chitinophaga sp. MM2321]|uniref:hypothetical protein n=1 Tax=Chitinophaga sp. MM2321 TaxID=3137178 RepID=UPI0032D5B120